MAIQVRVFLSLAASFDGRPAARLTLDGEMLRIGRAPGCDLRLPDMNVGAHHASLVRQNGAYALVDEGGAFSTWVGDVSAGGAMHPLVPYAPRVLEALTLARIGPFWLVLDPRTPGPAEGANARQRFVLELLAHKLRRLGHSPLPTLVVQRGPDHGARFELRDSSSWPRLVGRTHEADFQLRDSCTSRKHFEVMYDEGMWVRDLNSTSGTKLGGEPLFPWSFMRWSRSKPLSVGRNVIVHENPLEDAFEALGDQRNTNDADDRQACPTDWRPKLVMLRGEPSYGTKGNAAVKGVDQEPVESTIQPKSASSNAVESPRTP